jgi:lipopolysaccharide transport system ATP-binding protein
MPKTAITLESVGLAFPKGRRLTRERFWALDSVDLRLDFGDKLGVIGRNGAGKSTLLRVLAGALVPDRGRLRRNHGSVQLLAINLGFVHYLSGRDNAILSGLLQGLDRRTIQSRLPAIREFAGLEEFFEQPINTYSSGMVARLGFSVAMQLEPDVLLIDETLSVGDADFRQKSHDSLRQRFSGDHTVVLVSHNDATVKQLCNKVLWLEHGRTVMFGAAAEVLAAYAKAGVEQQSVDPAFTDPSERFN